MADLLPRLLVLLLGGIAGCAIPYSARPPTPEAPAPVSVSTEEIHTMAGILRAEDTRDPSIDSLRPHLASRSGLVRARAAVSVGRIGIVEGIPRLVELLSDGDTAVAAAAAFALGQIRDSTAVPALASVLEGGAIGRVTVAAEAAYALGKIGGEASRAALRDHLRDARVRSTSRPLVTRSALLAIWRFPRDDEPEPIARWSASEDPEIRWRAAYAMVRRPDPRSTTRLHAMLADGDERVRALAARGLTAVLADSSGLGAARILSDLVRALDDESYIVRINAIRALGTYRDTAAVRVLLQRLDSNPHEAFAASEALGRMGEAAGSAVPRLASRAVDERLRIALRSVALEALAEISPDEARRTAAALVRNPSWRMRAAAASALAESRSPAFDHLLRDPDGRVAAAALQAVVQRTESLNSLRPALFEALASEDVGVRVAALGAFRRLADPGTLPAMLEAYAKAAGEPESDARLAALEAIAALQGDGQDPGRAFFVRFGPPADPLVHRLAVVRFGRRAVQAWGPATPIETGRSLGEYRQLVERWVVPELQQTSRAVTVLETESGPITLRLFGADAPITVESFASLANRGYFDGQEWPRVVPNFVVQGGDPRGDTSGGPGYSVRDELSRHRYRAGTLGMALSGPDTGGSQFFITHSAQPHLDGIYAVFGETASGLDITRTILPGESIVRIRVQQR
jgi:cyclophilin family peptidyl-prolyl cis-trans isomerase/HEAT repeat protein